MYQFVNRKYDNQKFCPKYDCNLQKSFFAAIIENLQNIAGREKERSLLPFLYQGL